VAILGLAAVVLPRGEEPILCTLDVIHARTRRPWIYPENIMGRPFIRTEGGTKKWAEEVKELADCIRNHKVPETGGLEAMQALAVIVAAIQAARSGEAVSLAKVLAE